MSVEAVGTVLNDSGKPLAERFRALFTLRSLATPEAINQICRCFTDPSALLKHECAYCLGQMLDKRSVPVLTNVLEDITQNFLVRHEAAEALGAIGDPSVCDVLERFSKDSAIEVAETCQIALDRIRWLSDKDGGKFSDSNPYLSVDPAPPHPNGSIQEWRKELTDTSLPLFRRYRAMFSLRNHGDAEAVYALVSGFTDTSALFKHELAFILGQMKNEAAISELKERLEDLSENPMVRHECAEALGSIASEECLKILEEFQKDDEQVVRESCVVALDMYEYEKSGGFQYADTLSKAS